MNHQKIEELANYYGFDFVDLKFNPNYKDRKSSCYGLIDRRNGLLACSYSQKSQIKHYLLKGKK